MPRHRSLNLKKFIDSIHEPLTEECFKFVLKWKDEGRTRLGSPIKSSVAIDTLGHGRGTYGGYVWG